MSNSRISPLLTLTIIRQILRGEGEYAHIDCCGDQLDAIGEMVDQALSQVPQNALHVQVSRSVEPARLACLEALVLEARKQGMSPVSVSGDFGETDVANMPETIVAVFAEAEPIITFEKDNGSGGGKAWVKLNTQSHRFFQEWGSDGWYLVENILNLDPATGG